MDDQIILACDDNGKFRGEYIPKRRGHTGKGKRHLAITVLLYNNKGQVLLQKRKHQVFNDIWDLTGATHPLHLKNHDESFLEATQRCLKREYNIEGVSLKNLGTFNYFAQYGNFCEHEHCALFIAEYNGQVSLNPEVGYGYKWMGKSQFLEDILKHPQKYSAWAQESVKILQAKDFFNS